MGHSCQAVGPTARARLSKSAACVLVAPTWRQRAKHQALASRCHCSGAGAAGEPAAVWRLPPSSSVHQALMRLAAPHPEWSRCCRQRPELCAHRVQCLPTSHAQLATSETARGAVCCQSEGARRQPVSSLSTCAPIAVDFAQAGWAQQHRRRRRWCCAVSYGGAVAARHVRSRHGASGDLICIHQQVVALSCTAQSHALRPRRFRPAAS